MYTVLPKTKNEFRKMADRIFDGYKNLPVNPETLLRLRIDINYLLRESGLVILDEKDPTKRIVAYTIREFPAGSIEIIPVWKSIK